MLSKRRHDLNNHIASQGGLLLFWYKGLIDYLQKSLMSLNKPNIFTNWSVNLLLCLLSTYSSFFWWRYTDLLWEWAPHPRQSIWPLRKVGYLIRPIGFAPSLWPLRLVQGWSPDPSLRFNSRTSADTIRREKLAPFLGYQVKNMNL